MFAFQNMYANSMENTRGPEGSYGAIIPATQNTPEQTLPGGGVATPTLLRETLGMYEKLLGGLTLEQLEYALPDAPCIQTLQYKRT